MKRRVFAKALVALGCAAALPSTAAETVRIGALDDSDRDARRDSWQVFRRRMRELGYPEGANFAIEYRWANGDRSRLPALAAELVALKPEVIVTAGTPAALAAKRATSTIPIVFAGVGDALGTDLVRNLAHPEANLTGVTNLNAEVVGKWLELLREMAPRATSLAFLTDTRNAAAMVAARNLRERAHATGLAVRALDATTQENIANAYQIMAQEGVQGVLVSPAGRVLVHRHALLDAIDRLRLPAVFGTPAYPEAGGLLSYSANHLALWARAAEQAHRILKGAKPADIPVEQASTFQLVVNLKTARALGITIPQSILLRADQVIE